MKRRDYYVLLGIDRSATPQEIKRSYRRLAHQFHPDKNPGNPAAEEHFKLVTEAYHVLIDGQKRAAYDRLNFSGTQWDFESFRDSGSSSSAKDVHDDILGEIFEGLFGTRGPARRRARGADFRYRVEISLEEAALGSSREIRIPRISVCPSCRGTKCHPGTEPVPCPVCRGHGSLRAQQGLFSVNQTCGNCQGEGEVILQTCFQCQGKGWVKTHRTLRVDIPPGADEGSRFRLKREGEQGKNGGPAGDLYVIISVKRHPYFTRQGNDLLCEVQITPSQASRGAEIEVPTLRGKVKMKVPAGVVSGSVFTLKSEGMPILQSDGRGDQKVTIRVGKPSRKE